MMKKIIKLSFLSFLLIAVSGCKKLERDNLLDQNKYEKTIAGINLVISKFEITADDNNDQIANKGESISLKVYLKNKGTNKANDVKAYITCDSEYITSLSPKTSVDYSYYSANYIDANTESTYGGSNTLSNTLTFKVLDSAPNGTVLTFKVIIADSDNHTWTDIFSITVGSTNANIEFSKYEISADNNNDKVVNKGESISLKVYLKNSGSSQANLVKATISSSSNYVSGLTPSTSLNYDYFSTTHLIAGQESTPGGYPNASNTITFNVSNTTPNGTILTFNISIVDEAGNSWNDSFTLTVGSINANIEFSRYEISSDNNNDKFVNKGESISLKVYLKNSGSSQANSVSATITSSSNYISGLTPTSSLNYDYYSTSHLIAGQESTPGGYPNASNTISFNVSNTMPNGTILTFNIAIVDEAGNTWTDSFTITVVATNANIKYSKFEILSDNNNDKTVNKGETIALKVYLKNVGSSQANLVTAKITSTNYYVTNLSPTTFLQYNYYSTEHLIAGQESTPGGYPYYSETLRFNVSNSTPTGSVITFSISIIDESNNTWTDNFSITVI